MQTKVGGKELLSDVLDEEAQTQAGLPFGGINTLYTQNQTLKGRLAKREQRSVNYHVCVLRRVLNR
jgi:hypothetical protein